MRCLATVVISILHLTCARNRVWIHNADIFDPQNRQNGDCKGVHFSADNSAPIFIDKPLTTSELELPNYGTIFLFPESSITIDPDKTDCVNLKALDYYSWYDYRSWPEENSAVPHLERIPCETDSVEIPAGIHARIFMDHRAPTVKSLNFNGSLVAPFEDYVFSMSAPTPYFTMNILYKEPFGHICHELSSHPICPFVDPPKVECEKPILPEGFCHEICGASLSFRPKVDFELESLRRVLKRFTSDSYASLVELNGRNCYQVIFSENQYTGKSVEEARTFLDSFLKNYVVVLEESGQHYIEGQSLKSALGVVFGTFFLVLVVFGVIFYTSKDNRLSAIIANFGRGGTRSILRTPFFARFDNTGQNLIFEEGSMGGSVANLAQAFDNPLYGQEASTSSSTFSDKSSHSQHENPLYDVALKPENEE